MKTLPEKHSRELRAELEVLEYYDRLRASLGHDFGNGQRYMELARRRRELEALEQHERLFDRHDGAELTAEELARAFKRVGAGRDRRAAADQIRYGSAGVVKTARAWAHVRTRYGSV